MTAEPSVTDLAVDTLLACAAEWSGFQPEGVAREAVRRALARELASGASLNDVLRRAAASDPELVRTLRAAIGVRETFLFRNPEQFDLVASRVPATGVVRAWSAGCATGEETWSLAATLVATLAAHAEPAPRVAVLGTDIHEPSLEIARSGSYRAASRRASGPLLYPVVTQVGNRLEVIESLRHVTSFVAHDLRDPPPGQFEIIFCRNVLIYFARPVARLIIEHLKSALAPDGLLLFGTMDIDLQDMAGLTRVGSSELMAFTNTPQRRRRPTTRKQPRRVKSPTLPPEPLALHRNALVWIEYGNRGSAEKILADLNRRHPDYLPGLLERALVHVRKGEHAIAQTWMQEVLRRAEALPADHVVLGLEPLPASFYRDAARAYLDRGGSS